uniref:SWR1-complex protein 4 n=1 Tax=Schistosoma mansoni TaxID=6183 RepID=A0A5K4F131_SCHMA
MSTGRLFDHFGDNPADQEDSVDFEFFEEHRESIPESLKKNNNINYENNNSNLVKANTKTFVVKQKQEDDLYQRNEDLDLNDETYHSTEEEEENKKEKEDENNLVESPAFHKPVNDSDRRNMNKAVVKDIDNDLVSDDDDKEESVSSPDEISNIRRSKSKHVTSRNSPIRQSPDKNNNQKKQTRPSFHSTSNLDIYNVNNECINVAQIADALKSFDKKIHRLHIRPPWKDPNSRPLPSDRTIAFYNMYEDYLKYRDQRPLSSLGYSTTKCLNDEVAVRRLYHSTLNRLRQNEKIQLENYELAKRLQKIRPTTGMTREEQLRDYKKYFITPNSLYPYQKSSYLQNFHINQKNIKNKKTKNTLKPNELPFKSYNKYQTNSNNNNSNNNGNNNNMKRFNKDVGDKIKLETSYNSESKHESDLHSSNLNQQIKYSKQFNKPIIIRQQSPNNRSSSSSSSSSGSFNSSPELSIK